MSVPVSRVVDIDIRSASAEKSLSNLEKKSERLQKAIDKIKKSGGDATKQLEELADTDKKIATIKDMLDGKIAPSFNMVSSKVRQLRRELAGMSQDAPGYAAKMRAYQEASQYMETLRVKTEKTTLAMKAQSKVMGFLNNVKTVAAGVLIGNTVQAASQKIMQYLGNLITGNTKIADELSDIEKSSGLSAIKVAQLNKEIREIDTRTANTDLRAMANSLGLLGEEPTRKGIENLDKVIVALADDFKGDAGETAELLSVVRNNLLDFKTNDYGDDVLKLGNAFNVLSAEGIASGDVLADNANRISGVSQAYNLTSGQILGVSALFPELGIASEKGSTAFVRGLQSMTKDVETYGKIAAYAGIEQKEFIELVNRDALSAYMKVAEGARIAGKDNITFGKVLKDLDADGSGASEMLSKFSQNSELARQKVETATRALKETNSITDEFNKKNNNAAGVLAKIEKRMASIFTSAAIQQGVSGMINAFAEMIGAITTTERLVGEMNKLQTEVNELDRDLIPLVSKIDELKSKTNLSETEQAELKTAIEQLAKSLPYAVSEIDAYGNALDVSTTKAKEFIRYRKLALQEKNREAITEQESEAISTAQQIEENLKKRHRLLRMMEDIEIHAKSGAPDRYITHRTEEMNEQMKGLLETDNTLRQRLEGQVALLAELKGISFSEVVEKSEDLGKVLGIVINGPKERPIAGGTKKTGTGKTKDYNDELTEEEKAKIKRAAEKKRNDLARLEKEIEKEQGALLKSAADSPSELLNANFDAQIASIKRKYKELLELTHGSIKEVALLNEQQKNELDQLTAQYYKDRSSQEYEDSLKNVDKFYGRLKDKASQERLDGITTAQQYSDKIRQLDLEESEDRLQVAQDYAQSVKKAVTDAETFKTRVLQQGIIERNKLEEDNSINNIRRLERAVITSQLGTKKRLEAELALIQEKYRQELKLAGNNAEKIQQIEFNKRQSDREAYKQHTQAIISQASSYLSGLGNLYSNFMDGQMQRYDQELNREKSVNDKKRRDLDKLLEDKRISEEEYKRKSEQLDKEYAKKENDIRRKQFAADKASSISQAGINGALAITSIWAQYGANPIVAGILTALAAGVTGLQIANIASKKFKSYGKGGRLTGPSHNDGGLDVIDPKTGKKKAEVEGGEVILSKETVKQNPTLVNELLYASMHQNGRRIDWVRAALPSLKIPQLSEAFTYNSYMKNGGYIASTPSAATKSVEVEAATPVVAELKELFIDIKKALETPLRAHLVYKDITTAQERIEALKRESKLS